MSINLTQALTSQLAQSQAKRPPEVNAVMGKATKDWVKSSIVNQSLQVGDYVINTDGAITHAFVDPDYANRLDPEANVAALGSL